MYTQGNYKRSIDHSVLQTVSSIEQQQMNKCAHLEKSDSVLFPEVCLFRGISSKVRQRRYIVFYYASVEPAPKSGTRECME